MKPNILIVDDEKNTREGLKRGLEHNKYAMFLAEDAKSALEILSSEKIDIMLTDLKMPGMDGIELMHKAKEIIPDVITVILTAYGSVEAAVSAMKQGAYDFVTKPINLDEVDILVKRALSARRIEKENIVLRQQLEKKYGFDQIIGNAPQMKQIFETIKQVAPTKATVLITGESGTGKELIANAIHLHSLRKDSAFVDVHCAALAETLLESELFGHEKGAFTGAIQLKPGRFELADGGTLFMDEVSEMDLSTQVKLLRILETQKFKRVGGTKDIKVDIRLIAATNTSLEQRIKEGEFREDLYYRLNVVAIKVPPLRERKEDIPLLVNSFLKELDREHKKQITSVRSDALQKIMDYSWPGNVRELRNMLESIVILSKKHEITLEDLPVHVKEGKAPLMFKDTGNIQDAEKALIIDALRKTDNNKTKAAQIIGISRRTLHRKLNEYGV
jgi:DNA-binding NtrC family response regulator